MSQPAASGSAGAFSVDLERAPDAIRELERAKVELEGIRDDAMALGQIRPPAADQVSMDAAQVFSSVAVGGPVSFVTAVEAGIRQLDYLMERMHEELKGYRHAEESAVSRIAPRDHD